MVEREPALRFSGWVEQKWFNRSMSDGRAPKPGSTGFDGPMKLSPAEGYMTIKTEDVLPVDQPVEGAGMSIAHQIVAQFLTKLEAQEGYDQIGKSLRSVVLKQKPTEESIREALFGEPPL
jgi:hypothetical protein